MRIFHAEVRRLLYEKQGVIHSPSLSDNQNLAHLQAQVLFPSRAEAVRNVLYEVMLSQVRDAL